MTTLSKPRQLANRANSVSVTDYGVLPTNTAAQNATAIALANTAVAGGDLSFPSGTFLCDGFTGITGKWKLAEDTILKHNNAASGDMIAAIGDFTIEGGTIDGNKDNQTGRYSLINFIGDNLIARFSTYKNSIEASIIVTSAATVDVHNNRFEDLAEHTGVTGENSTGVDIDGANTFVRAHINDNFFINPTFTGCITGLATS